MGPDERKEIEELFQDALVELELEDMTTPIRCGWAYYFDSKETKTLAKTPYLSIFGATKQEVADILSVIEESR